MEQTKKFKKTLSGDYFCSEVDKYRQKVEEKLKRIVQEKSKEQIEKQHLLEEMKPVNFSVESLKESYSKALYQLEISKFMLEKKKQQDREEFARILRQLQNEKNNELKRQELKLQKELEDVIIDYKKQVLNLEMKHNQLINNNQSKKNNIIENVKKLVSLMKIQMNVPSVVKEEVQVDKTSKQKEKTKIIMPPDFFKFNL